MSYTTRKKRHAFLYPIYALLLSVPLMDEVLSQLIQNGYKDNGVYWHHWIGYFAGILIGVIFPAITGIITESNTKKSSWLKYCKKKADKTRSVDVAIWWQHARIMPYRQGWPHSLLLWWGAAFFVERFVPVFGLCFRLFCFACAIGATMHIIFDLFDRDGVALFQPFYWKPITIYDTSNHDNPAAQTRTLLILVLITFVISSGLSQWVIDSAWFVIQYLFKGIGVGQISPVI